MKNNTKTLIMLCVGFLYQATSFAATYSVEYAPSSPIQKLSLKDAQMSVELYSYSNPSGFVNVRTDSNQSFTLKHNEDLEIVSIKGQEKYNAICSGYATETRNKIQITCTPRNDD